LAGLKRPEEAEHAYHAARKLKPKSERPYLGLGAVAMLQENWPAAMYAFMMALAANPDTMKGEFGVGLSLAARSLHDDAIALFSRVLEREPFNAEALFHLYRSAMESGQPRLAIEPLEKYLTRFPDDNNFLFNLCGAYWKAGELTRAADLCRQVLDRDPEHAAARDVLEHVKSTALAHA
jgi:tetratricopeptide (TPR) repeat protein